VNWVQPWLHPQEKESELKERSDLGGERGIRGEKEAGIKSAFAGPVTPLRELADLREWNQWLGGDAWSADPIGEISRIDLSFFAILMQRPRYLIALFTSTISIN